MAETPAKRQYNISPEAREKLSKAAKERHARGEFGGAKFGAMGGRAPRKKQRIARKVAEAAEEQEQAEEIINVFRDAIHPNQPIGIRLKGAQAWVDIAIAQGKFQLQEEAQEGQAKSRDELVALMVEKLSSGPAATLLRKQLEEQNIVDAEVVEDE